MRFATNAKLSFDNSDGRETKNPFHPAEGANAEQFRTCKYEIEPYAA